MAVMTSLMTAVTTSLMTAVTTSLMTAVTRTRVELHPWPSSPVPLSLPQLSSSDCYDSHWLSDGSYLSSTFS